MGHLQPSIGTEGVPRSSKEDQKEGVPRSSKEDHQYFVTDSKYVKHKSVSAFRAKEFPEKIKGNQKVFDKEEDPNGDEQPTGESEQNKTLLLPNKADATLPQDL